jgi:hypothetical protein
MHDTRNLLEGLLPAPSSQQPHIWRLLGLNRPHHENLQKLAEPALRYPIIPGIEITYIPPGDTC